MGHRLGSQACDVRMQIERSCVEVVLRHLSFQRGRNMKQFVILGVLTLAGCATTQMSVQPPANAQPQNRSKEIARSKDAVWNDAVAKLGQRFFVINNLDKSSGLINVSYSGNPETYVDCGKITVTTNGPRGGNTTFNGSAADVTYMAAFPVPPYNFPANAGVRRQMELEGRVNVIFEAIAPDRTRVTAATKYILTRKVSPSGPMLFAARSDTISFNANETGHFPPAPDGRALTCVSTGALESSLLDAIN